MKIYTKTGDKGETSLFGGSRVRKYDLRIESYGTVDELNAHLGLLRDELGKHLYADTLIKIQAKLFTIGAMLATPPEKLKLKNGKDRLKIPVIAKEDAAWLEAEMDLMNDALEPMTHFILPGGHRIVSLCHVARCVCRRAERLSVELSDHSEVQDEVLIFLNRLSDYLFVLARMLSKELEVEEIPWKG